MTEQLHTITRGRIAMTQWPGGLRAHYGQQQRETHYTATCTCGWTAESSVSMVVVHLCEDHTAKTGHEAESMKGRS
ncbi:hypothetical protein [Microbacterium rhizosphaerae]|uniref:Uncharacterized protein n=1 Tax=Microbacterium rhizosphaerae TaxID=1678237 RepID=A0ABZ0SHZ8_9MICO|nr:hypothetical protein [Microbacterium rhizosphaerae]WPR88389.1 hypothetical protein SM116_11430 [Microbacterium rhizosphaerae]